jgi:hypothetical protein
LQPDDSLDFDRWVDGIRDGRSYCCDGATHLFDFRANGLGVGEPGDGGRPAVLATNRGQNIQIDCKAAALLPETPHAPGRDLSDDWAEQPYWHLERARVKRTRQVPVELVVNGLPVEKQLIEADGSVTELQFEYTPKRSSWIAIRILPAAHTNPIFVEVDGAPIRASRRSAQWCLDAVERCWTSKSPLIRESERSAARAAYDHAAATYRQILAESPNDL